MIFPYFKIKGQRGFGDSLCLYPIVKHLSKNKKVIIYSDHEFVFKDINCICLPYDAQKEINAGYLKDKTNKNTNQLQDICNNLRIKLDFDFSINVNLEKIKFNTNKKVCLVNLPYLPFPGMKNNREQLFDLMPNRQAFINIFKKYKYYYFVGIGKEKLFDLNEYYLNVNYNLFLRLIYSCDVVISQPGHMMHAAELLNKKSYIIFSKKAAKSSNYFINTITPKKVIFKKTSFFDFDDNLENSHNVFESN